MGKPDNEIVLQAVEELRNDLGAVVASGSNANVVAALRELRDKIHAMPSPRTVSELDARALGLLEDVDTSLFTVNERFRGLTNLIAKLQDKAFENEIVLRQLRSTLETLIIEVETKDSGVGQLEENVEALGFRLDDIVRRQDAITESFQHVAVVLQEYQAATIEQVATVRADVQAALASVHSNVQLANAELESRLIDEIARSQKNTRDTIKQSQDVIENKLAVVKSTVESQSESLHLDLNLRLETLEGNLEKIIKKLRDHSDAKVLETESRIVSSVGERVTTLESRMVEYIDEALSDFHSATSTIIPEEPSIEDPFQPDTESDQALIVQGQLL